MNVRCETIKLLEKNVGGSNLLHAGLGDDFLNLIPKITKVKLNKRDYIKLKRSCITKETIIKAKRQPIEWEKTFAGYISHKGLTSKIYNELI